jgi:hypothetical protein
MTNQILENCTVAGAPKGNRNRAKDKLVEAALRRELTQDPETALKIARACIKKACDGDIYAAAFIRDTVDGKPREHLQIEQEITVSVGSGDSFADKIERALSQRARPTVQ